MLIDFSRNPQPSRFTAREALILKSKPHVFSAAYSLLLRVSAAAEPTADFIGRSPANTCELAPGPRPVGRRAVMAAAIVGRIDSELRECAQ